MPAPAAGHVIYRFSPPTDSWTGQFIDSGDHYGGSITDTYDLEAWAVPDPPDNDYTSDVFLYKTASVLGWIHRFKCTFSLDTFPSAGNARDIFGLFLVLGPWQYDPLIVVNSDGTLAFDDGDTPSVNAISTGVSYELELYVDNRTTRANPLWQLWIDGVKWLEDTTQVGWWVNPSTPGIWCGYREYSNVNQNATVVLHMEDIVWTIEIGFCGWTMMAP